MPSKQVRISTLSQLIPYFRFRYVVLIIALFGLTSISSNMFTVNIALICMSPSANTTVKTSKKSIRTNLIFRK